MHKNRLWARTFACVFGVVMFAGCDHREGLLGADDGEIPADAPVAVLPPDTMVLLREGGSVRIALAGNGDVHATLRVSVLLLDSAKNVLWRSPVTTSDSGSARVPITALPAPYADRGPFFLTAAVETSGGRRVYAGDDGTAAGNLASAATVPAIIRGGRVYHVGSEIVAFANDPTASRVFFTRVGSGDIGVFEPGAGVGAPLVKDAAQPSALAVAGRRLAYLADAGSKVVFVPLDGSGPPSAVVLRGLQVRLVRTYAPDGNDTVPEPSVQDFGVRPYATSLSLFCAPDEVSTYPANNQCNNTIAVVSSPTTAEGDVLRLVQAGGSSAPPIIAPEFTRISGGADSIAAQLTVASAGGERETLAVRARVTGCVLGNLGVFDISAVQNGRVFAAVGGDCGPGARLVRIDAAAGNAPRLSQRAIAAYALEDRIGAVTEVQASPDGSRVLVRDASAFWLLDEELRVIGSRPAGPSAVAAWLIGSEGSLRVAIAEDDVASVFEAESFSRTAAIPTGPVHGHLGFIAVGTQSPAVIFVPRGDLASIVVLPLPGL